MTAKRVLLMDEVDGMAGNEDRGGIAELIALLKTSKVRLLFCVDIVFQFLVVFIKMTFICQLKSDSF